MRSVSWMVAVLVIVGLAGLASAADLYVPTGYATIQAAIDAASPGGGDIIHIAAGTYVEQLHVDRPVTLDGAGVGSTIVKSPAVLLLSFMTGSNYNKPVIFVDGTTGVVIQNLTVDGDGKGNANVRFQGIAFWNAGGSVSHVAVLNVRETPFSGAQHGVGVYAYNNGGGPYVTSFFDVLVEGFQKNGFALMGEGLTADLDEVTVNGVGATGVTAQNGIQIAYGADASLTDCLVDGIGYTGTGWIASGMLLYQAGTVDIGGDSSVTDSQASIVYQETGGTVSGVSVSAGDIVSAEGISIRDYGSILKSGGELSTPVSPLLEEGRGTRGTATVVSIDGASFTGVHHAGSYGIAAWALGDDVTLTVTDSEIVDWEIGVVAYESGSFVAADVSSSKIESNDAGLWTNATGKAIQLAEANWWGHASGPYNATTNPDGLGNEASDGVDYGPWYAAPPGTSPMPWGTSTSIQEAIDAASPGAVVHVAAGTYAELITINKALSLLGAGAATTTIDASSLSGPDAVVDLCPTSGNVTFDGFTVKAGSQLFTVRHSTAAPSSVVTISHNHLVGYNQPSKAGYDYGVIGGYGSVGKIVVSSNVFDSYYNNPILFERHKGISEVVGNTIQIADGADGIYYMTYNNDDVSALQSIRQNVLTHQGTNRCGGIYINSATNYATDRRGRYENVEILDNTVYGVDAQKRGIGMGNDCNTGDGSEGEIVAPRIRGNRVFGTDSTTNNRGLQLIGYITNADVRYNSFNNLQEGIRVWDGAYSPGYFPVGTVIRNNSLAGCNSYGLFYTGPATPLLMAERNWWGDASGPSVAKGTGSPVTSNVDYDPWIGKAGSENIVCVPDPQYLKAAPNNVKTVDVYYNGNGAGLVYGYSVKFSWAGAVATTALNKVTEGTLLSSAGTTTFFKYLSGTNEITVDCTLTGGANGVTGPGTMFTIEFTGNAAGTSPVDVTVLAVRDKDNNPIYGFYEDDGQLIVDLSPPTVTNVLIANTTLAHTDDYVKNTDTVVITATVSDNVGIASITANLSGLGGGAAVAPDSYVGGVATWTLASVTTTPANGTVTVTVTATDTIGNTATGSDTIIADNTKPSVVTNFNASPDHNECQLSWGMGTDLYLAGVTVRRATVAGDYPTYLSFKAAWPANEAEALYPANHTAGVQVYNGTGTSAADADTVRTIHYYQAFCYDEARNYGVAAAWPSVSSRDLATNYWLGDVAAALGYWGRNGLVNAADIDKLAGQYGTTGPWPSYYNRCDVGPTVHPNGHRLGVPFPSNTIQFEDLMIFAMNYGVVAPRVVPFLAEPADEALALSLEELSASPEGELQVALRLEGNAGEVKGVSTVITYDPAQLEYVSARLSDGMASPIADVFFWSGTEEGKVQVDLAVLGTGVTIGGSGEVAVLTFRALGGEYALGFEEALLRGVENEDLEADLEGLESRPEVPTVFRLAQNVPNPFSVGTAVVYEVPQSSAVTIRVYDVTGRLVRTLVDGTVEPGRYSVEWDGTASTGESVGSGVYFCVMEAPEYHATQKMMLLK